MSGDSSDSQESSSPGGSVRRRRPRYPGTHPRRFEQRYKELVPQAHADIHEHVRAQGRTPAGTHVPVLVDEVLRALAPPPGSIVADGTIGYGGHAEAFLRMIGPEGRLIGLDVDRVQLERTRLRWLSMGFRSADDTAGASQAGGAEATSPTLDGEDSARDRGIVTESPLNHATFSLHRCHFAGLPKVLARENVSGVEVIFADLGVSSMQIDDPARGFSYRVDGPLDMRMDDRLPKTAADLVHECSEAELSEALRELADEPHADRIARSIVVRRAIEPIRRTTDLVRIVLEATGTSRRKWREQVDDGVHPAARTFQALRMLVNDEMGGLDQFLRIAPHCLTPGGRLGIISFHSGEDRRVKHAFRDGWRSGFFDQISENVIRPEASEIASNPRSRSARFRWARRAATH